MNRADRPLRTGLLLLSLLLPLVGTAGSAATDLQVTGVVPAQNSGASVNTTVSVTFDLPLATASITSASFRVFGRSSGTASGIFSFSNGDRTVTFDPAGPFAAGEVVSVNLSHDIRGADLSPLRAAGYAFQFMTLTVQTPRQFEEIDIMSNRIKNQQTRIYGASSSDLNEDGFLDLTTVNEVSADVRVFLNLADGSGLYAPFLAPQTIGVEASPNEPADFNNDGHADLGVCATVSNSIWVLLGVGDGTFNPITEIPVGLWPHGIAVLDVDGDADWDIVNSNNQSNNLSLMINNGNGVFGSPSFFDAGISGEYGIAAGDMNRDGIADVVAASRDGERIITLLGNGNGTFTPGASQDSGGRTWVVALADLNGDQNLDATAANSTSNNGAVLIGLGNGNFGLPTLMSVGSHTPSTDLGDLDGDGDIDWILSSYGGGFWRLYINNGSGSFTFDQQFDAPSNPSCAVLLDFDNDRDLDMALTDEIADVVVLMRNVGGVGIGEAPEHSRLTLLPNFPEPFRAGTRIRFELIDAADVGLQVVDVAGRRVATRWLRGLRSGLNEYAFDGRDDALDLLPSGIYFYTLAAPGSVQGDRMTIVR